MIDIDPGTVTVLRAQKKERGTLALARDGYRRCAGRGPRSRRPRVALLERRLPWRAIKAFDKPDHPRSAGSILMLDQQFGQPSTKGAPGRGFPWGYGWCPRSESPLTYMPAITGELGLKGQQ